MEPCTQKDQTRLCSSLARATKRDEKGQQQEANRDASDRDAGGSDAGEDAGVEGVEPISSTGREIENRATMPAATTLAVLEDRDG